jgi:hypothetical protein
MIWLLDKLGRWSFRWHNRRARKKVGNAFMWLAATQLSGDGNESDGMDILICAFRTLDKEYDEADGWRF